MAKKIKAYKISKANLKNNKIPNYSELNDGISQISPIKMRKVDSFNYHVAEDVKGDIYLIDNDVVMLSRLYDRNIGVCESAYRLDGVGRKQIEKAKENAVQEVSDVVESSEVVLVPADTQEAGDVLATKEYLESEELIGDLVLEIDEESEKLALEEESENFILNTVEETEGETNG